MQYDSVRRARALVCIVPTGRASLIGCTVGWAATPTDVMRATIVSG
jgi:hypothetical protein